MTRIAFLHLKTTGLDPARHDIWEIGVIIRDYLTLVDDTTGWEDTEYCWQVRPDLTCADPAELRISRYYERCSITHHPYGVGIPTTPTDDGTIRGVIATDRIAHQLAALLDGALLVGAGLSTEAAFLTRWLPEHGQAFTARHLIGFEAMAVGFLRCAELPWDAETLSRALGVNPDRYEGHTALGAASWVRAQYDAIMHGSAT